MAAQIPNSEFDIAVVGAGLSGLTAALNLTDASSESPRRVLVLDGRSRVGGRLHSHNGVDLGASWTWTSDSALRGLAQRLGVSWFAQPATGIALHDGGPGRVQAMGEGQSPCGPGGSRLEGSTTALIDGLVSTLESRGVEVRVNATVHRVTQTEVDGRWRADVELSDGAVVTAKAVVLAAPPRVLAEKITFEPALPPKQAAAMASTPTWMEETGKIIFFYQAAFWDTASLSGTVFSDSGPMQQIWDASDRSTGTHALAGFIFPPETADAKLGDGGELVATGDHIMESLAATPLLKRAQHQLVRVFGPTAGEPTSVTVKSWLQDDFTTAKRGPVGRRVSFGSAILSSPHHAVFFAGTETEQEHGHMEGAVTGGVRVAEQVHAFLSGSP